MQVIVSKNMGNLKSFPAMFLILLSMQFAMSNGDWPCFVFKYATCYAGFLESLLKTNECIADPTVQCLKDNVVACDVTNTTEVYQMEQVVEDVCNAESDLHKAFLSSKDCLFGQKLAQSNAECSKDMQEAMKKYKPTGDAQKDLRALFKISCKYGGDVTKCQRKNVESICGAAVLSFQKKLNGPASEMEEKACNSAATFGFFWTLLLQSSAILMSLQYFRLTK